MNNKGDQYYATVILFYVLIWIKFEKIYLRARFFKLKIYNYYMLNIYVKNLMRLLIILINNNLIFINIFK